MKFKEHYELWNFSELEEWSAHSDIPRDREIFCHSVQSVQMILKRRWRINGICVWSIGDLTEVFPCFFLGCKAKARVILAKTGNGPQSSKIVVLFYVLFVLYRSMYCLCVNVYYCHRVTTQLQLTNISYHYHNSERVKPIFLGQYTVPESHYSPQTPYRVPWLARREAGDITLELCRN